MLFRSPSKPSIWQSIWEIRAKACLPRENATLCMPHTGLRGLSDPISGEEELPNAVGVQPSRQFFYGTAIALFVYGWLSVNIYLPILPKLESIFQTTPQMARLTVTVFLIGFSLSQLVWGPLSDRF